MSDGTVRVYVDGRGVDVAADATALDAVRALDAGTADLVAAGARTLTDSRGLPIASDAGVHWGAIFRVVGARSRAAAADDPTE